MLIFFIIDFDQVKEDVRQLFSYRICDVIWNWSLGFYQVQISENI